MKKSDTYATQRLSTLTKWCLEKDHEIQTLKRQKQILIDGIDTLKKELEGLKSFPDGGASDFCKPKKSLTVDIRGRGVGDLPYVSWEKFPPASSKR